MVGLAVLAVVVAYIALWWFIYKKARNRPQKIAAVLIALLIPFWDLPFGYYAFKNRCREEGGLHFVKRIPPQQTICAEMGFNHEPEILLKRGFEVVEVQDSKRTIRFKVSPNGSVESMPAAKLTSAYCVALRYDERLSWNTYRREFVARDVASGAVAARYTTFTWQGSWWIPASMPSEGHSCFELNSDKLITLLREGTR